MNHHLKNDFVGSHENNDLDNHHGHHLMYYVLVICTRLNLTVLVNLEVLNFLYVSMESFEFLLMKFDLSL